MSHDFIARAVARYLGRQRGQALRRAGVYAAPVLFVITLLLIAGAIAWSHSTSERIRALQSERQAFHEVQRQGVFISGDSEGNTWILFRSNTGNEVLKTAAPSIARLRPYGLSVVGTSVTDLTPLQDLTALQELDLSSTLIADLAPLRRLTALQKLSLNGSKVIDLAPLQDLTALQVLDLWPTGVTDLTPLLKLPNLRIVGVYDPKLERSPAGLALIKKGVSFPP